MNLSELNHDSYLTPTQVGGMLEISERTLSRWHRRRIGPPRVKVGRMIFYRAGSVVAWLKSREVEPTA